jgi:hypothetical protein
MLYEYQDFEQKKQGKVDFDEFVLKLCLLQV